MGKNLQWNFTKRWSTREAGIMKRQHSLCRRSLWLSTLVKQNGQNSPIKNWRKKCFTHWWWAFCVGGLFYSPLLFRVEVSSHQGGGRPWCAAPPPMYLDLDFCVCICILFVSYLYFIIIFNVQSWGERPPGGRVTMTCCSPSYVFVFGFLCLYLCLYLYLICIL